MESEGTNSSVQPNNSLKTGPNRALLVAEMSLLKSLGFTDLAPVSCRNTVLVLELFLALGGIFRLITMHLAGQMQKIDFTEVVTTLFTAADKTNTIDKENIKVMHMLFSLLVHVLLVPQLYMMVIVSKEKTTLMLQLILVILLLIFTASTQGLLSILKYDKSCQERNTCMHRNWGWFLFLNIVVFVSIILVRLLYNLRWREWLLNIKVLGPILDFLVSRKCRDFQALCLLLTLSATTMSGISINSNQMVTSSVSWMTIVADLMSCLFIMAGLLGLLCLYFITDISHSHRNVVTEQKLEQQLQLLALEHRDALIGDRGVSDVKYSPFTRSCDPGSSEQRLFPSQQWMEERREAQ